MAGNEACARDHSGHRARGGAGNVDCAVIIVTYNSAEHIVTALDSLREAAGELTLRVIVVDNGSRDGTAELVRDFPHVSCVETGMNLGYAGGINVGREHAGGFGSLLVLNPDVLLLPGSLLAMQETLREPGVGVVVPKLLDPGGERFPSVRREPTLLRAIGDGLFGGHWKGRPGWLSEIAWSEKDYTYPHPVDWATGAVWLISASCDEAVGRWDERFFLFSEETDYAARVRGQGFLIKYQPMAQVVHSGSGSGQWNSLVALNAVNRVRYADKHRRCRRCYHLITVLHELLRCRRAAHREALRALVRPSGWPDLVTSVRTTTGEAS